MLTKNFKTLIEMLAYRAKNDPEKVAFTFLGEPYTYAGIWTEINHFGAYLQELGISHGDRVVLALPNSAEFFGAFYGVQRVGAIAVPLFPGSGPKRIFSVAKLCGARVIVAPSSIPGHQLEQYKTMGEEQGLDVVTTLDSQHAAPQHFPTIKPEDVAFIQFTSGSTGNPKGVQLSHDNLITNVVQMIIGMEITKDEIFVSWLPVYHDMGLILKTMVPFYLGAEVHLLEANLRNIRTWLNIIQKQRATFTAAPDFAYRLCVRHVDPGNYDLSSLRVALNAAEPVRAETIRDFEDAFGLKDVMVAGYGLAEATVGVSMWKPGSTPRVDGRGFVSVGLPFPEVEVKIIENGKELPSGEIGEIAIRSTANSRGYLDNPEETDQLFTGDGFLLSGDLGYLDKDGYLYIISRKKNIIKRAGQTISPHELEEIVDRHDVVRYSAAIGVDKGGIEGEQIYIFAEIRNVGIQSEDDLFDLTLNLVDSIHADMGFRPGRVYLLKRQSIPLTHNGKIQHARLKAKYLEGDLRVSGAILFPDY
ncbi:MAG: AMP-binding protein [Anaerolineales bacterium]|nr:AMP-binding protein [Chloroflexota bacterium]MBL6980039.1 AMP-binding protein [Anaerolineales bacterium]